MEYLEIVKSAISALKNNKLRTSLTMIGIIIGITSVILIYSIGQGAVAFITRELSSFGTDYFQINPGNSQFSTFAGSQSLTFEDMEAIENDKSLTNIKYVVPMSMASVKVQANGEEDELLTYGTTHQAAEILKPDIIEGEFLTEEQVLSSENVAILGEEAAETFFGEESSPVGQTIRIHGKIFRVTGVLSSSSALAGGVIKNSIFIPVDVVTNEILGRKVLQEIDISVHDQTTINQTMDDVEIILRDRHDLDENDQNDFQIASAQDILTTVETITSLLTPMIVSSLVAGVGMGAAASLAGLMATSAIYNVSRQALAHTGRYFEPKYSPMPAPSYQKNSTTPTTNGKFKKAMLRLPYKRKDK
jgi:putative ABC transport system permease protein